MKHTIVVAVVFLLIGGVVGHFLGHSHHADEAMEMDEAMTMEDTSDMESMATGDNMAMDMSAMNPEGLPMGVHNHPMREVDQSLPIPSVSVEHMKDKKGGYALELRLENFTFEPALVDQGAVANEGHAHIYVNNVKIARLYDNWFHLDQKHLTETVNTVEITLNANDHSEWAVDGNHIQTTIKLAKE